MIIVDDNDPSSEHRAATAQLLQQFDDPRIKYVALAKNSGACIARNQGVQESRAELVAFLDDDDVWRKDKLQHCIATFQQDSELGLLIHNIKQVYRDRVTCFEYHVDGNFYNHFLAAAAGVSCSAIIVRKSLFMRVGGFDPDLASYQDLDLMLRMSGACKADVLSEVLLEYQLSDTGITFNFAKKVAGAQRILDKFYLNDETTAAQSGKRVLYSALGDYNMMLGNAAAALQAYRKLAHCGQPDKKSRFKLVLAQMNLTFIFRLLINLKKRFA
ncbi:hypothetical protein MACH26_31710 [Planctobacterium marinum]|uniref:Glycosyltransferase 2-like domain-containing protein n=2 Tax=Planctobacterium marinum TaxID=1631968 RepID=A0AA48I7Z7_9ALTE|nr:hypothetical protein MACH26_31710 [Planctobacterium marinum]